MASAPGIAILGTILGAILFTTLLSETRANLASVPGLPPAAQAGIAEAIDASAGQALTGFKADPRNAAVIRPIEDAFVDAARAAGLGALAFVILGLGLSFLLPESAGTGSRRGELDGAAAPPAH